MNKKIRDILFLLGVVILAISIGLIINGVERREGFVPGLNAFYRPYARKTENFTSEKINNISNIFTRFAKNYKLI
uniref:Uncharacterized protein n=1 Tax=viral metagenome TaxID=1070528 RepID=A0A6C0K0A5_9ZZZZ